MEFPGSDVLGLWVIGAVGPRFGGGGGAGWVWLAVGLVAAGVGIVAAIAVRAQRQLGAAERAAGRGLGGEETRFATGEVLADLDELSRRLAEELDEKAARLERLIAEADARAARLEAALRQPAAGTGNGRPAGREGEGAEVDPVSAQVLEMADQGLSAVEIARSLGQHVGKVELILALRR